jgi:D-alanyl-D-alanine carboxypeptidase
VILRLLASGLAFATLSHGAWAQVAEDSSHAGAPAAAPGSYLFARFGSVDALVQALPANVAHPPQLALHLQALVTGYGEKIDGVTVDDANRLQILLSGHSLHLYDDGQNKTPAQRLDAADLRDMFHDRYPLQNPTDTVPADFDPGRARPEPFFQALYGSTAAEVSRSLVAVDFCGRKVSFNSRNGAADALKKVAADLVGIFARRPELRIWAEKLGGTYNWRPIAGTNRLSMHSYGVAIDLNTEKSDYWRWKSPAALLTYSRKTFPVEIIEAFERNGFIWGGKWYHFDSMHFEYRPEVLAYSRLELDAAR